jgi:hypothetical protein
MASPPYQGSRVPVQARVAAWFIPPYRAPWMVDESGAGCQIHSRCAFLEIIDGLGLGVAAREKIKSAALGLQLGLPISLEIPCIVHYNEHIFI